MRTAIRARGSFVAPNATRVSSAPRTYSETSSPGRRACSAARPWRTALSAEMALPSVDLGPDAPEWPSRLASSSTARALFWISLIVIR